LNETSIVDMILDRAKFDARARQLGEKIKALGGAPTAIQAMERTTEALRAKDDGHRGWAVLDPTSATTLD